jgi:hypothetical protein
MVCEYLPLVPTVPHWPPLADHPLPEGVSFCGLSGYPCDQPRSGLRWQAPLWALCTAPCAGRRDSPLVGDRIKAVRSTWTTCGTFQDGKRVPSVFGMRGVAGLEPSREAVEWGRRQASRAPRWDEAKWDRIAAIFQVAFLDEGQEHDHQDDEQTRGAA